MRSIHTKYWNDIEEHSDTMSVRLRRPPPIDNIQITEDGTMARFTLPSLAADALDRHGNMANWKLSKIFECGRVLALTSPGFFMNSLLRPEGSRSVFIIIMDMDVERLFHARTRQKGWTMSMDLATTVIGFGRSSINYMTTIEDPDDHAKLATLKFRYAMVDLSTRKSVVIPDEFKDKYKQHTKPEYVLGVYNGELRPDNAFCMEAVIKPSDIDFNNHLNQSYYIRFCMDCASEAAYSKRLRQFDGNITRYNAKKLKALFKKECRLGDTIQIYCWEDEVVPMLLHFDITNNGKPSFQSQVEFHFEGSSKL